MSSEALDMVEAILMKNCDTIEALYLSRAGISTIRTSFKSSKSSGQARELKP